MSDLYIYIVLTWASSINFELELAWRGARDFAARSNGADAMGIYKATVQVLPSAYCSNISSAAMNTASYLIQELLGLSQNSTQPEAPLTPKQVKNDDHGEQGGATTGGHHQRKRRRQDADSVGEEIAESEGT